MSNVGSDTVVAPTDPTEWGERLRRAGEQRLSVRIAGNGTSPAGDADLVLSTRAFRGVVAYEPGDGTLTARAGSTMAELAEAVTAGGHRLTPDVARPEQHTLGGVLASGISGFDRLRFGPVRHNVLGMTVCLADGRIARTGGRLVKNVTGYDLHRLYCGSRGTLCVVLEASLRLYPASKTSAAVTASFAERPAALATARRLGDLPIRPTAVCVHDGHDSSWSLFCLLEGRAEVVDWELERVREVVERAEVLRESEALQAAHALRDRPGPRAIELGVLPSRLERLLASADEAGRADGRRLRVLVHPLVASVSISVEDEASEADLEALGNEIVPPASAPGSALTRKLKAALDPDGIFPTLDLHERA